MYDQASYDRAQEMMRQQRIATHHPLYKMAERGRTMRVKPLTTEGKKAMIDHLAERWALLPPGEDRNIQQRAMLAIMEDRPMPCILTSYELDHRAEQQIKECRHILRAHYKKKGNTQ